MRSTVLVALALSSALLSHASRPAMAQPGPAADGAVRTAPADAPVTPPTPEQAQAARKLALARSVYDLIGTQTMASTTRVMTTSMEVQVARAMTDKDRTRARAIVAAVNDGMDEIMPQIVDSAVAAMTRGFTVDELQDMLAFYRSASGQAALHRLPLITQQSMSVTLDVLPTLMGSVQESFCRRVTCSARDKQAFADAAERLAAARPKRAVDPQTAASTK